MTKINNKLLGRGGKLIRGSGDPFSNGISIAGEISNKILKKNPFKYFSDNIVLRVVPTGCAV